MKRALGGTEIMFGGERGLAILVGCERRNEAWGDVNVSPQLNLSPYTLKLHIKTDRLSRISCALLVVLYSFGDGNPFRAYLFTAAFKYFRTLD